jgi:type II secretory pathway component PulJ
MPIDAEKRMPQILFFAALGAVAWFGYRQLLKEAERVNARVRRAEKEAENRATGTLVRDPDTGEYRLEKRDEDR